MATPLPRLLAASIAALALVLPAVGCAPPNVLEEGEVIGKDYDDPDTWTTLDCAAWDGNMRCLFYVNNTHHDSAHWFLIIRGQDKKGKWLEERHEVTQTFHDEVDRGQYAHLADESIVPR